LASGKAVVYDTDLALGYVPRQMAKLKRLARSLEYGAQKHASERYLQEEAH